MMMFINFLFSLVMGLFLTSGLALPSAQDGNSNISLQPRQDGNVCTPNLNKNLCGVVFQLTDKTKGKTANLYVYTAKCIQIGSLTNTPAKMNNFNLASSLSKPIIITSIPQGEGPGGPPIYDISLTYDGYKYGPTGISLPHFGKYRSFTSPHGYQSMELRFTCEAYD